MKMISIIYGLTHIFNNEIEAFLDIKDFKWNKLVQILFISNLSYQLLNIYWLKFFYMFLYILLQNSVRHNLSLNKCFEKVDSPKLNGNTKKGCLWALNPAKIEKMEDEIAKHRKKDLDSILKSMSDPGMYNYIEIS